LGLMEQGIGRKGCGSRLQSYCLEKKRAGSSELIGQERRQQSGLQPAEQTGRVSDWDLGETKG